jgi:hypothetical protein
MSRYLWPQKWREEIATCLTLSIILADTQRWFPFCGRMHRWWHDPLLQRSFQDFIALGPSLQVEEPILCPSFSRKCAYSCRSRRATRHPLVPCCRESLRSSIWDSTRLSHYVNKYENEWDDFVKYTLIAHHALPSPDVATSTCCMVERCASQQMI